jgi:hydroxyethylthiazole kinase-like uncharacterized protein yjeF
MQWILSAEEMKACDRKATDELGLPSICLMENAGRGMAEAILDHLEEEGGAHVTLCCGAGNNGGDGWVVARCLANAGVEVVVLSTVPGGKLKGDAAVMRGVVERMGLEIIDVEEEDDLPDLRETDLIVDALLGTGCSGAPRGVAARLIAAMGDGTVPVWSVDLPSGVDATTGEVPGLVVQAARTYTMAAPTRGLLVPPGRDFAGEVTVVDIGYDVERLLEGEPWAMADPHELAALLPPRAPSGHKGDFGKVLVLAGSPGMGGAAMLCAQAVLKAGAGLVRLAATEETLSPLIGHMPEVMTLPLPTEKHAARLERLLKALEWADILAVGPGLGRAKETLALVRDLVLQSPKPVVLDADGLEAFRGQAELLGEAESALCLTPHAGEFDRLTGGRDSDSAHDRALRAQSLATELGLCVVLKGAPSVVAMSTGDVLVNGSGNDGMATGGTGDVLTGLLAGLAVQGMELDQAALLACHVHGLAGDLVAERMGRHSLGAADLLAALPLAMMSLMEEAHSQEHACGDACGCAEGGPSGTRTTQGCCGGHA